MSTIRVLTYNTTHRKTYDTLCLLKARGYEEVSVYAQAMTYKKKYTPLVKHRPTLNIDVPNPQDLCRNIGYKYTEGDFEKTIGYETDYDDVIYLLCGAGILSEEFIKAHRIVNSHPGYIPLARGLDAYKWSVYYGLPIGATTHIIGEYVDAGEIIERREISVSQFDTFHSIAQLVYENEIDMLIGAISKINEEHSFFTPSRNSEIFKRMPADKEKELFDCFERHYH